MKDQAGMPSIGFVGLGTMGAAMAANLVTRGFEVTGWNRTSGRAESVAASGVRSATSLAELAAAAGTIVICVSDTPDVEGVLFGEGGLAAALGPGRLVIDCSTIAPGASRAIAARLATAGIRFVDAPMSGGSEGARNATLTFFVGGETDDVDRARPVLEAMGRTVTHVGPVGSGQAVKAVNQVVLAGTYLGVAEGMVLALKAGLDPGQVTESLGGGAAQSWVLANRSARMVANDYPLGFRTSLHLKDLGIALDLARTVGATLPVTALAAQLEAGLVAEGHGDEDISNLARAIRRLSGLEG